MIVLNLRFFQFTIIYYFKRRNKRVSFIFFWTRIIWDATRAHERWDLFVISKMLFLWTWPNTLAHSNRLNIWLFGPSQHILFSLTVNNGLPNKNTKRKRLNNPMFSIGYCDFFKINIEYILKIIQTKLYVNISNV